MFFKENQTKFFNENQTKIYLDLYKTLYAEMYTNLRLDFTNFQINANLNNLSVHTTERIIELNAKFAKELQTLEKIKARIDFLRSQLPKSISDTFAIAYPIEAKFIKETLAEKDQLTLIKLAEKSNTVKM